MAAMRDANCIAAMGRCYEDASVMSPSSCNTVVA